MLDLLLFFTETDWATIRDHSERYTQVDVWSDSKGPPAAGYYRGNVYKLCPEDCSRTSDPEDFYIKLLQRMQDQLGLSSFSIRFCYANNKLVVNIKDDQGLPAVISMELFEDFVPPVLDANDLHIELPPPAPAGKYDYRSITRHPRQEMVIKLKDVSLLSEREFHTLMTLCRYANMPMAESKEEQPKTSIEIGGT